MRFERAFSKLLRASFDVSHEGCEGWLLYPTTALIAFTSFTGDALQRDSLSGARVLLVVGNTAKPHEDAVLCEELPKCRCRYALHGGCLD